MAGLLELRAHGQLAGFDLRGPRKPETGVADREVFRRLERLSTLELDVVIDGSL